MAEPESSTITAIEPQAHHPGRVSLFVDGEFAMGIAAEVVLAAGLRVGQPVTAEQLQALARAEEVRRARESAFRLLAYRARSRAELEERLRRKGHPADVVEEVLDGLARSGFVDDAEFSQSWVRARTGSRPMGTRRIAAELRRKGVAREVIEEALAAVDPELELDLALAICRKKVDQMRGEDPRALRRKVAAALQRRGFPWETCARVLDIVLGVDE